MNYECQLCDLSPGDKFRMPRGTETYTVKEKVSTWANCRNDDSERGVTLMLSDSVVYLGTPELVQDRSEISTAPRILKGSELLVGDVVEYVAGDTGPGPATVDAFNHLAPFAVLVTPELTGANARCNKQKPWRYEPDDCFRLISRLDPKPEFPRQGTRKDLVPGMRYCSASKQEFLCIKTVDRQFDWIEPATGAKGFGSFLDEPGEITLLGVDPGFKDQTAETTLQDGKAVNVKTAPVPPRPDCEDCLKPHTFAAGYGTLVEQGLKGEWLCTDCRGGRRNAALAVIGARQRPVPKPRKLAPGVAYHLNDVGGDEGPGWSE